MAIYSGFSHEKWWFSIAMLIYQRVYLMRVNCYMKVKGLMLRWLEYQHVEQINEKECREPWGFSAHTFGVESAGVTQLCLNLYVGHSIHSTCVLLKFVLTKYLPVDSLASLSRSVGKTKPFRQPLQLRKSLAGSSPRNKDMQSSYGYGSIPIRYHF